MYELPESAYLNGYTTILTGRVRATPSGASIRVRIQPHWRNMLGYFLGAVALYWLWDVVDKGRADKAHDSWSFAAFVAAPCTLLFLAAAWHDVRLTERELRRVLGV